MSLAEELGAAVQLGDIDMETAARQLVEASGGRLTVVGARDVLAKWQTVRAGVADTRMAAEMGLAAAEDRRRRERGEG